MIKFTHPSEKCEAVSQKDKEIQWIHETHKESFGEKLTRNLALAGMLVITISAIRNTQLPSGQTVLTAVQHMIVSDWDETLGKISFVSHMFPETVSVFFSAPGEQTLIAPCAGIISHPWSQQEPYLAYDTVDRHVYALADGHVMSVAHGINEERIIRIRQDDGLETLYYNLADTSVREGDAVTTLTCLGEKLPGAPVVVEVRKDGLSINPTSFIFPREEILP